MSPKGGAPRRCRLCGEKAALFYAQDSAERPYYWRCPACGFIFLDPRFYPSPSAAKERYLLHDNTAASKGYGEYLERFVRTCVLPFAPPGGSVLDFGSGPQNPSLLSSILLKAGYSCDSYDPLFFPARAWRRKKYRCIILHEVAEHLTRPTFSFSLLAQRLEPEGILAVRTRFPPVDRRDFGAWWYRMDITHISFYPPASLQRLAAKLGLSPALTLFPDSLVFVKTPDV